MTAGVPAGADTSSERGIQGALSLTACCEINERCTRQDEAKWRVSEIAGRNSARKFALFPSAPSINAPVSGRNHCSDGGFPTDNEKEVKATSSCSCPDCSGDRLRAKTALLPGKKGRERAPINGYSERISNMSLRIERIEWETIDTQKLKGATAMQYYFAVAAFWSRNVEQVLWETAKSPRRQHTFDA
ncbi:hypothetical protein ALC53_11166 [Atta colombica]|uniref:Uncharacterized protein n=1 Tax=Atta colombica TaxID=520822 RepID=A0A195B207_9HYME|nr:hypothetical protein ALC53_11166 [Atta colombica]